MAEREQEVDPSACRLSSAPDETLAEDEEFRPAEEVFRDPSALDFLMQHGGPSHGTALSRQSLFVKFDPLVGGRPSAFPVRQPDAATGKPAVVPPDARWPVLIAVALFVLSRRVKEPKRAETSRRPGAGRPARACSSSVRRTPAPRPRRRGGTRRRRASSRRWSTASCRRTGPASPTT